MADSQLPLINVEHGRPIRVDFFQLRRVSQFEELCKSRRIRREPENTDKQGEMKNRSK